MKLPACLVALLGLAASTPALAQVLTPPAGVTPTFHMPLRVRAGDGHLNTPRWSAQGLHGAVPDNFRGLAKVEQAGLPVYDPSTHAWYATANGALVRLERDGKLPVLLAGALLQGRDLDVRARLGIAVSREPDHRIMLLRWREAAPIERRPLLSGARFFYPRLSPDGQRVLVTESRPGGAHVWVVAVAPYGTVLDLGRADDATWHPDGRRILFSVTQNDGHRVTGAELWEVDVDARRWRRLTDSPGRAEVEPAVSPDGQWVAFVDAANGDLYLARYQR